MLEDSIGGEGTPATNDPAYQAPREPLAERGAMLERVRVIHREIPDASVRSGWDVCGVRNALIDLTVGQFDAPAQLMDALHTDSRVHSAMKSRSAALLGRPVRFKIPDRFKKDDRAIACQRAWGEHWPQMSAEAALVYMLETSHTMGFAYGQLLWDTGGNAWRPYLETFNPRFSYYHWLARKYVAITMDGTAAVSGGDGHWVLHAPYGSTDGYRSWMRGAIRPLSQWWLAREYALRDFARYCERHGFPMLLADTPFGADPSDIASYQAQLQTIGQESVLQLPGSVDLKKFGKYDLRYLEPKDANWQAFKELIELCSIEITLALLGQNLTSEVKEGSLAAARVHANTMQAWVESDARAVERTLYNHVLRPFAALNYGDPDLAPRPIWNVKPPEDFEVKARALLAFGQGLNQLRLAGIKVKNPVRFARTMGLALHEIEHVDPTQIAARVAGDTGKSDDAAPEDTQHDDEADEADEAADARRRKADGQG